VYKFAAASRPRGLLSLCAAVLVSAALAGCADQQPDGSPVVGPPRVQHGSPQDQALRVAERTNEAGDYATALKLFQDLQAEGLRTPEVMAGLGRSFAGLGMQARAEQSFRAALAQDPGDPALTYELAKTLYRQDRTAEAEVLFRQALTADPDLIRAYAALGATLDRQERYDEAQAVYAQGLQRDPTDLGLLNNLALSYALAGDYDSAIRLLTELVKDPSAGPQVRQNLALVYGLAGRFGAAAATASVDLTPEEVERNLAFYRMMLGKAG